MQNVIPGSCFTAKQIVDKQYRSNKSLFRPSPSRRVSPFFLGTPTPFSTSTKKPELFVNTAVEIPNIPMMNATITSKHSPGKRSKSENFHTPKINITGTFSNDSKFTTSKRTSLPKIENIFVSPFEEIDQTRQTHENYNTLVQLTSITNRARQNTIEFHKSPREITKASGMMSTRSTEHLKNTLALLTPGGSEIMYTATSKNNTPIKLFMATNNSREYTTQSMNTTISKISSHYKPLERIHHRFASKTIEKPIGIDGITFKNENEDSKNNSNSNRKQSLESIPTKTKLLSTSELPTLTKVNDTHVSPRVTQKKIEMKTQSRFLAKLQQRAKNEQKSKFTEFVDTLKRNNFKIVPPKMNLKAYCIEMYKNPLFNLMKIDYSDPFLRNIRDEMAKAQELGHFDIKLRLKIDWYSILRRRMKICLNKMKQLKVTPREVMMDPDMFSNKPFQKEGAKELINNCSEGNVERVKVLIEKYGRRLIHDFDNIHMNPLHWAVKNGHYDLTEYLLNLGADPDGEDIIGRTPLYFALQFNHHEIAKVLICHGCNPWSTDQINYSDVCFDRRSKLLLAKYRVIDITLRMTPPAKRTIIWEKNPIVYIMNPKKKSKKDDFDEMFKD